jgi:hypothetical protein
MKTNYIAPAIKVAKIDADSLLQSSVTGTTISGNSASNQYPALSKEALSSDRLPSYSVWGDED